MRHFRGIALALGLFAASFALHIAGGATGQGWLFAIAVGLIYVTSTAFPAVAAGFSGRPVSVVAMGAATVTGIALTSGALWAANGRAWAPWTVLLAIALVAVANGLVLAASRVRASRELRRSPAP